MTPPLPLCLSLAWTTPPAWSEFVVNFASGLESVQVLCFSGVEGGELLSSTLLRPY